VARRTGPRRSARVRWPARARALALVRGAQRFHPVAEGALVAAGAASRGILRRYLQQHARVDAS
jgi:hypothetical protein